MVVVKAIEEDGLLLPVILVEAAEAMHLKEEHLQGEILVQAILLLLGLVEEESKTY